MLTVTQQKTQPTQIVQVEVLEALFDLEQLRFVQYLIFNEVFRCPAVDKLLNNPKYWKYNSRFTSNQKFSKSLLG